MKRILVSLALLTSCGKGGGGKNDDVVGGEEKIIDSFSCIGKVPSMDKDGNPDKVRGFDLKLVAFKYGKGSSASSLTAKYIFNSEGQSFEEVASRVWPQSEKKTHVSTELLLAKVDMAKKEVEIYKKYAVGQDAFDMECQ